MSPGNILPYSTLVNARLRISERMHFGNYTDFMAGSRQSFADQGTRERRNGKSALLELRYEPNSRRVLHPVEDFPLRGNSTLSRFSGSLIRLQTRGIAYSRSTPLHSVCSLKWSFQEHTAENWFAPEFLEGVTAIRDRYPCLTHQY